MGSPPPRILQTVCFHLHKNIFLLHTPQPSHFLVLVRNVRLFVPSTTSEYLCNSGAKLNVLNYPEDQVKFQVLSIQLGKSVIKATVASACILVE